MATSLGLAHNDSISKDQNLFRELSLTYREFGRQAGVEMTAFRNPALPLFSEKSPEARAEILRALGICVTICERTVAQGYAINNSPALIWAGLKEFGLRPCSDTFGHITDDNVIEIHSGAGVQIFRNFAFYKYCSYTIEELYCGLWHTLFERDPEPVARCIEFLTDVYTGKITRTVAMDVPPHSIKEIFSEFKYEVELALHWGAPLYGEGTSTPKATIVIASARLLNVFNHQHHPMELHAVT